MSELVVYKNEMNTVPLRNFNSKEMDLFFSICSQMREKDLTRVEFTFEELKDLSDYKHRVHERFIKDISGVYNKLTQLNIRMGTSLDFTQFVLFTKYTVSASTETVTIQVNEEFKDILNNITGNFTKFELKEFTRLVSSYSKTVYRLLRQYKSTGYYIVKMDEFRRLLDIPESYRMSDINRRVLTPVTNELQEYYEYFEINKIRGKGKRKRFIDKIEFKFSKEDDIKYEKGIGGVKTFRDEDGNYYEKHIEDFDEREVEKTFYEVKPVSEQIEGQQSIEDMLNEYYKKNKK